MQLKWLGALLIVTACGGCGAIIAFQYLHKIRFCKQFIAVLEYMECELAYRAPALPQLCVQAAGHTQGVLRNVLLSYAREMETQIAPDLVLCMSYSMEKIKTLDEFQRGILSMFAVNLGHFDIPGQLKGLEHVKMEIGELLTSLLESKNSRIRSYQTLGLCAGAALVILFV